MMKDIPSRVEQRFSSSMVRPVNMESLKEIATGFFKDELQAGEWPETRKIAVYLTKTGEAHILDQDCVEVGFEINFYRHAENRFGGIPEFCLKLDSWDELPVDDAITVKEFMGDRYGYNSRVLSNMNEWMKLLSE